MYITKEKDINFSCLFGWMEEEWNKFGKEYGRSEERPRAKVGSWHKKEGI